MGVMGTIEKGFGWVNSTVFRQGLVPESSA